MVDLVKGKKSELTGEQVLVVAAGGIFDGRGMAAALNWGAAGVWVGTRFVCATEAGAPPRHQVLDFRLLLRVDECSSCVCHRSKPSSTLATTTPSAR